MQHNTPLKTLFLLLCGLLLAVAPAVNAETGYVIDQLLVGVHESKDLDSAIIKVLPTGTVLEILQRDGELAQVEDPDQVRGWVDAAYLTTQAPAALRLAELEREKSDLVRQLQAASSGAPIAAGDADSEALMHENTELKGKLSSERLRAGKLQSEVANLRAQVRNQEAPPDQRIVELEQDRDALQDALDRAESQVAELAARASLSSTAELVPLVIRDYLGLIVVGLLLIILFAGAAGAWALDALNRRRHGGFRV